MQHVRPAPLMSSRVQRALSAAAALAIATLAFVPGVLAAGPPFPDPVNNQAVYDTADVLSAAVKERVEATIDAIETRTGAEVVVYTQLVPYGITESEAKADAIALMDQWGVGRKGIDDGLVILFDLHENDPCHGQVQLYAGPGFQATFLTNEERQAIFEDDMLPHLYDCDLDSALLAAIDRVDAAASPEHARTLELARQANAVIGLILAPLVAVLIVGWSLLRWYREGRDPVYLDDASILMPAPPPGLTPAAGAALRDGSVGRRSLTAASLDLAVRGHIGFTAEPGGPFGGKPELGIVTREAVSEDPVEQARMLRARRRPLDPATAYLRGRLSSLGALTGYIEPARITELGSSVSEFDGLLETHLVGELWYREKPSLASTRWAIRGALAVFAGIGAIILGANLPAAGIVLLGISLVGSGIAVFVISYAMPKRTQAGAVIRAMLEAYRRTLEKTMAQARSMGQVVTESAIPLIESPDDAVVWGVALGLQDEVEQVLARSSEDLRTGGAGTYVPTWYVAGGHDTGRGAGSGGWAPGLMDSSPIPNFGGMMAALGTIGNSPASSGSGSGSSGGGGFSGGSSGGGGGGAGGGF